MRIRLHIDSGAHVDAECDEFTVERHPLRDNVTVRWKNSAENGPTLLYVNVDRVVAVTREDSDSSSEVGRCGMPTPVTAAVPGLRPPPCCLPAGHAGWHRNDDGTEWGRVPISGSAGAGTVIRGGEEDRSADAASESCMKPETEQVTPCAREPRRWHDLHDVPADVALVTDVDGRIIARPARGWSAYISNRDFAPWTEVIDDA